MNRELDGYKEWYCPNCGHRERTPLNTPNRWHTCPQLRRLSAPLVAVGTAARVYLRERQDYVGREHVRLDPEMGRPVMSIVTERADGSNDAVVFAPAIKVSLRSLL